MHIANVCEDNILRFAANLQKYQTLVPARNSQLKVRPRQFNSLFNGPDRPYIVLIPKELKLVKEKVKVQTQC